MVIVSITPEIAIDRISTYAGGLGVLEGDKFFEMSKNSIEYLILTLLYRKGYIDYDVDNEGRLRPRLQENKIDFSLLRAEELLHIEIRNEIAEICPWTYVMGKAKLVLFEVFSPQWLKEATERLYIDEDEIKKIYKWIALAKASAEYLRKRVGLNRVDVIDLQESYTSLLIYALPEYQNFRLVIHTPGPWGHPSIPSRILENEFNVKIKHDIDILTRLALERVSKAFAVSRKHYRICRILFSDYVDKLSYVTNGVSMDRWRHPYIKRLIETRGIEGILSEELWNIHLEIKKELIRNIVEKYSHNIIDIDLYTPIIVWCRRITKYKRPYFITWFIEEIGKELNALFIVGGKPHPLDSDGIRYAEEFLRLSKKYKNVVFIYDYDITKARILLSGSDIHLFTSFPGWEACGTSYMKAASNGVPTLSSRDGGALEIIEDGISGWFFGSEADKFINIYDDFAKDIDKTDYKEFEEKLQRIIKIYGSNEYKDIMLNTLKISERFNIKETLRKYYQEL